METDQNFTVNRVQISELRRAGAWRYNMPLEIKVTS